MIFYKCAKCGNVVTSLNKNSSLKCCDNLMEELKPGSMEAALEKHIPVVRKTDKENNVVVGEVFHPMSEEHYIEFIAQEAGNEVIIVKLKPNDEPKASFPYRENTTIYAYCNLHGLWQNK